MFEEWLREGKARPDFTGTDSHQATITPRGEMKNPHFVMFLERVSAERQISFSVEDLLILGAIASGSKVGAPVATGDLNRLFDSGVIGKSGRDGRSWLVYLSERRRIVAHHPIG